MAVIVQLIEPGVFDQDAIEIMRQAFEFAHIGRPDVDEEVLARKIIQHAKTGERDASKLCATVLNSLDPLPQAAPMADYRLYLLDKNNRVAGPPEVVSCDTDDAAIIRAKQMVDGHDVEVWEGARFVAGIKSTDPK